MRLFSSTDSKFSDGNYVFMLGESYLQAQLDILKNATLVYPLEFYQIQNQLAQLTSLMSKAEQSINANAYSYLASPDYPVQRDAPKRIILLVLGLFVGGLLSSIFIIIKALFKKV